MNVVQLIERKKRGERLTADEIAAFVDAYTADELPDYQAAALLMAVWFNGMDPDETTALTDAMLASGDELAFDGLPGPTADKHSTGGVGDKVSLLLAPLAAACGLFVPMLSGRGLGHTGGTLDKLEAIPGYRIRMENDAFKGIVADCGCAIVGQGERIAPADGRIYALRDVTGTVDCVPLITASIMSKKLAAGPRNIVIDLKVGSGAFMTDLEAARDLATALLRVGRDHGRGMSVLFSDMSQPLGVAVGNAGETIEAFAALRPGGRETAPPDLTALTEALVAEMLVVAGTDADRDAALSRVRTVWDEGAAFARLQSWVAAQDGRIDPDREDFGLDLAPRVLAVEAPRSGWLAAVACRDFGPALVEIGGARSRVDSPLDLSAGIDFLPAVGDRLEAGDPVAWIRSRDADRASAAAARLADALVLADEEPPRTDLILGRAD